jgi:hypothetical protein
VISVRISVSHSGSNGCNYWSGVLGFLIDYPSPSRQILGTVADVLHILSNLYTTIWLSYHAEWLIQFEIYFSKAVNPSSSHWSICGKKKTEAK